MTDEELLIWLRVEDTNLTDFAADRIEELIAERDQHWDSFVHWRKEADDRSEQLAAARRDVEIAEEELELQEEEACMMENSYFELEKELNTCRMAQAVMDNTVADLEAKLAKAVEALPRWILAMGDWDRGGEQAIEEMTATLAEIKSGVATTPYGLEGESHDPL